VAGLVAHPPSVIPAISAEAPRVYKSSLFQLKLKIMLKNPLVILSVVPGSDFIGIDLLSVLIRNNILQVLNNRVKLILLNLTMTNKRRYVKKT
jgi:hypothetical protein